MYSTNHKSHPSLVSSLPGAAETSAAIRRGQLEISNPIPIRQEGPNEPDVRIDGGRHAYQTSSTTVAKTDTWPRRSTAPSVQLLSPQDSDESPVFHASDSHYNTNRTSAALTTTQQSMSSLPLGGSLKKGGAIRAAFRRMFGSRRRRDTFSTDASDQRSVGDTALHSHAHFLVQFPIEPH